MLLRKMFPVSLLLLIVIGLLLAFAHKTGNTPMNPRPTVDIMEMPELLEGDLIFRKGRSLVSTVVLMNDRASAYSHVGIVSFKNGNPFIVHAVPGEPDESGEEKVKCDTPVDFLNEEKASLFAIYRLAEDEKHKAKVAAHEAMNYYEKGLSFDKGLDFRSDDKLYCTELVWKAYLKAGINLTGNKFHVLSLKLIADSIILPGQFIESEFLTQVYP